MEATTTEVRGIGWKHGPLFSPVTLPHKRSVSVNMDVGIAHLVFGYDHITENAPDPFRTLKLNSVEPG